MNIGFAIWPIKGQQEIDHAKTIYKYQVHIHVPLIRLKDNVIFHIVYGRIMHHIQSESKIFKQHYFLYLYNNSITTMTTGLVALPEIRSPISVGADSDHDDYCGSMMNFPFRTRYR